MAGAAWVRWVFAAMCVALALFYVVRFLAAGRARPTWESTTNRSVDITRCAMSLGMVAMLVPWIDPLPRVCWQVLFSVATGHTALRLIQRRGGHHELHLMIGATAMVYTLAMSPAGPAMPVLAWVFITYFLVFVGAQLAAAGNTLALASPTIGGEPRSVVVSPHLLDSSEIVMAIGMSYMIMTML